MEAGKPVEEYPVIHMENLIHACAHIASLSNMPGEEHVRSDYTKQKRLTCSQRKPLLLFYFIISLNQKVLCMLKKIKDIGKVMSKTEMKKIAGGRVVCHNITAGGQCASTACWLQSSTRCCCAET